jgi:hypothetical protein
VGGSWLGDMAVAVGGGGFVAVMTCGVWVALIERLNPGRQAAVIISKTEITTPF